MIKRISSTFIGMSKLSHGLITLLNVFATGYSLFVLVEPFLNKQQEE